MENVGGKKKTIQTNLYHHNILFSETTVHVSKIFTILFLV